MVKGGKKWILSFISLLFVALFGLVISFDQAAAASISSTITGSRSYSVNMNSIESNGINGGNPNGIIPFTIIGAPPAGSTVIYLTGLNWQFSGAYGNSQNQYNKASVSFLFVQQAENAQMPKTFTKNIPVISSTRTNKGNIVQGNCYFPNENNDSLVVQCDYITEDYSSFTDFYFQWGSSSIQTQLAQIGSIPNVYNTHPISLSIGDIQIISTADPLIAGQNQIINQNQTIINQNQQMITGMEVNNQLQQNQNDFWERQEQAAQEQSDDSEAAANSTTQDVGNATQNILQVITGFFGAFMTATATTCVTDWGIEGFRHFDFCATQIPNELQIIFTIVASIIFLPMIWFLINSILGAFREFQQ